MPNYDTSYLISQVKRRGSIPTSQQLFTQDKLVLMLNDELKTRVIPTLMALRDDWFLTYQDYTADGITTTYSIPSKAVGNKLASITIWENGKQTNHIQRLSYTDLKDAISGFYVESNNIIFYPNAIGNNKTIRLAYYKRVDDIVLNSAAGYISGITGSDISISTTLPTTFITGASVQIVNNQNPFNVIWEGTISNVVGSTLTLDSTPTGSSIGNYLCLSGETIFPFIPIEMYPYLCQSVVSKCLEALGDSEGLAVSNNTLQQIEFHCKETLSPRIDGNPKRLLGAGIARFMV